MNVKTITTAFIMFLCQFALIAQEKYMVRGTVTAASDNSPVPGVNVLVFGTTSGVVTDFDGNYEISVSDDSQLVFSYVGFATQTLSVDGRKEINVALADDAQNLDEVVVVGYGTRKKSHLTGAG